MNNILVELLIILHICIWLFILLGGYISPTYAKNIIYIIIPLVYVIHILPFHLLTESKLYIINKNKIEEDKKESSEKILNNLENKYIIHYLFEIVDNYFSSSFGNPLSPQGLLILGFIINTYMLKYKWKECIY